MRAISNFIRRVLLVSAVLMPSPSALLAQQSAGSKSVLVLHWYDRNHPTNLMFDQKFQAAVQSSAQEGIDYYYEYLETNKFGTATFKSVSVTGPPSIAPNQPADINNPVATQITIRAVAPRGARPDN